MGMPTIINDSKDGWSSHRESHHVKHIHVLKKLHNSGARGTEGTTVILSILTAFGISSSKTKSHPLYSTNDHGE